MAIAKRNKQDFWDTPQRQSPVAIVLILLRLAWNILKQLWPLLLIFVFNPSKNQDQWWLLGLSALGGLSAILSIIAYFKFYFYIQNDELVVEQGIFQRKKTNIPFDRIQTIRFNQTLLHRFFEVVALEIDTAGSAGKELSIQALSMEKAESIRKYLLAQQKEAVPTAGIPSEAPTDTDTPKGKLLLHLDIGDLIKIGFGQNHIRSVGILAGTFFGWMQFAEDIFGKKQYEAYQREYFILAMQSFLVLATVFIVIAFVLTLVSTVIQYYDLRFYQTAKGFNIQQGLFTRKENTAPLRKIQFVRWTTNPLKRLFSLYELRLFQAASRALSARQSIRVPGCYDHQIQAVRHLYFPEEQTQSFEIHRVHPRLMLRNMLLFGVLPAAVFALTQASWDWLFFIKITVWLLMVGGLSYIHHRKWQYAVGEGGIQVRRGLIGTTYTTLQWHKIQTVSIRQTIFQKRHQLGNLYLYTAAGVVAIPYMEMHKIIPLKNYILYIIERSQRPWM